MYEIPAGWTCQHEYRVLAQEPILFKSEADASLGVTTLVNALNKELFESAQGAFFFIRARTEAEGGVSFEAVEPHRDWTYWFDFTQKGIDVQWRLCWAEVDFAGRWSNGWQYTEGNPTPHCRYQNDALFDECRTRLLEVISRVLTKELLVDENRRHRVRTASQSVPLKQAVQPTIEASPNLRNVDYGDDL
jgi:hypothetical protein